MAPIVKISMYSAYFELHIHTLYYDVDELLYHVVAPHLCESGDTYTTYFEIQAMLMIGCAMSAQAMLCCVRSGQAMPCQVMYRAV